MATTNADPAGPRARECRAARRLALLLLAALVGQQRQSAQHSGPRRTGSGVLAVSVQRLQVPDLVVVDQAQQLLMLQQRGPGGQLERAARFGGPTGAHARAQDAAGPQAASLVHGPEPAATSGQSLAAAATAAAGSASAPSPLVTFECLISYDRKRDKNLIVKWHHDERNEPIYQWIPELNKRTVAPQYRAFVAPILSAPGHAADAPAPSHANSSWPHTQAAAANATAADQVQLLEAGFRLVRPTKELAGRYTCSAISSQNDDSKSKKMIVYTPPRSFRFNASRTDIGALLASQRERLIQLTQPAAGHAQLPLAYRMRGLDAGGGGGALTTISPQMYSTIDYVNVNQQRARPQQAPQALQPAGGHDRPRAPTLPLQQPYPYQYQQQQQQPPLPPQVLAPTPRARLGVKLVCDIDQVFPVPEVTIYRLGRLEMGAHPERLAKLDTKVERDPLTGLFRIQVTSILDDDELANIRQNYLSAPAASASANAADGEPEIHFECLIALASLELSRYADNKRHIIYRPAGQHAPLFAYQSEGTNSAQRTRLEQLAFGSSGAGSRLKPPPSALIVRALAAGSLALLALLAGQLGRPR